MCKRSGAPPSILSYIATNLPLTNCGEYGTLLDSPPCARKTCAGRRQVNLVFTYLSKILSRTIKCNVVLN